MARTNKGALVISLDFELYWGVRDLYSLEDRKENLLQVRSAVPRILDLFEKYEIHATWATVGLMFCRDRNEMFDSLPAMRPSYTQSRLSPYPHLDEVGEDEHRDPFHYGSSMIRAILETPHQEVGTHTFSHYYCLEDGQTEAQFRSDLEAAIRIAAKWGVDLRSLVFPRNQVNENYLDAMRELGIESYRGAGSHWIYKQRKRSAESQFRRVVRLLDAYFNLSGHHTLDFKKAQENAQDGQPFNFAASRLLRGFMPSLRTFESLRISRICKGLDHAAKEGEIFHLWCHPEELSSNQDDNIDALQKVLGRFAWLRDHGMMESLTLGELSSRMTGESKRSLDRELATSERAG